MAKILLPNIDLDSIPLMEDICQKHPHVFYPMMGLHPCSVNKDWESQFAPIEKLLREKKIHCPWRNRHGFILGQKLLEEQKSVLVQLKLANELNLPVVIHARDSFKEIFEVFGCTLLKKTFWCFSLFYRGNKRSGKIKSYPNFYFGIGGVLTYKNSGLSEVLKHIPLNKLILKQILHIFLLFHIEEKEMKVRILSMLLKKFLKCWIFLCLKLKI